MTLFLLTVSLLVTTISDAKLFCVFNDPEFGEINKKSLIITKINRGWMKIIYGFFEIARVYASPNTVESYKAVSFYEQSIPRRLSI